MDRRDFLGSDNVYCIDVRHTADPRAAVEAAILLLMRAVGEARITLRAQEQYRIAEDRTVITYTARLLDVQG